MTSSREDEVARELVVREILTRGQPGVALPNDLAAVMAGHFAHLTEHLQKWFGEDGFGAIVARTFERARELHPLLADATQSADGAPHTLRDVALRLRSSSVDEAVDALSLLLSAFLSVLGRLVEPEMAERLVRQSWPARAGDDRA